MDFYAVIDTTSRVGSRTEMNSRRQFFIRAPLGFLIAADACGGSGDRPPQSEGALPSTPGAPPTFGTGAGAGPAVSPTTFAEAEKLMQISLTEAERRQLADTWRQSLARSLERRAGPRTVSITPTDLPGMTWNPALPEIAVPPLRDRF